MTPAPFTYLDLAYNSDPGEPGLSWAGVVSLEKTYSLDPRPANLAPEIAQRIQGVHGCLWSETLVSPDRPDYMLFPRLCALAEVGWTPQNQRSWPEFQDRVYTYHLARLDAAGVAYRVPPPRVGRDHGKIRLLAPYVGADVRYTLDGTEPSAGSARFCDPLSLEKGVVLKACTFRPNGRASRTVVLPEPTVSGK